MIEYTTALYHVAFYALSIKFLSLKAHTICFMPAQHRNQPEVSVLTNPRRAVFSCCLGGSACWLSPCVAFLPLVAGLFNNAVKDMRRQAFVSDVHIAATLLTSSPIAGEGLFMLVGTGLCAVASSLVVIVSEPFHSSPYDCK